MNGHGGERVGSGRKPKGGKPLQAVPFVPQDLDKRPEGSTVSAIPPEDLSLEEKAFWHQYAQRAIEQGTLTTHTVAAFRLLCELDAEKRATRKTIDADGRIYIKCTVDGAGNEHQELKAHPLTGPYHRLAKQIEALMGRFKLAPFGKPEAGALKKPMATNPWSKVVNR